MLNDMIRGVVIIIIKGKAKKSLVFQLASLTSLPLVGMVKKVETAHLERDMKLVTTDLKTAAEHLPFIIMILIWRHASGALSAKPENKGLKLHFGAIHWLHISLDIESDSVKFVFKFPQVHMLLPTNLAPQNLGFTTFETYLKT